MSIITNLYTDPKALQPLAPWHATVSKNSDGKYVYTGNADLWCAVLPLDIIRPGYVVAVDFSNTGRRDAFTLESCKIIYSDSTTLAGVYSGSGNCTVYCAGGNGFSETINRIGVYTPDDWDRLRQYGLVLFDGDTMPLQ